MNKIIFFFLVGCISFFILNESQAQSIDWKYQTNDFIFKYELPSNRVVLIHGKSNGTKVVKSIRQFPSVTALDKNTGKKVWEIKNPINMMGASEKEKNAGTVNVNMKYVKKNSDYIRFGHLMVVDSKDGNILYNPTQEGITEILHSKLFPEGIMATAKLNGEMVQLFLSFTSWKIAWTKKEKAKKNIEKKTNDFLVGLMSTNTNSKNNIAEELSKFSFYNGIYFKGDYIINHPKNTIVSFNLITGDENWKYESKNVNHYTIGKDKKTNDAIIYITYRISNSKSDVIALNYKSGELLWKKTKDYTVDKLKIINNSDSVLVLPSTNVLGKRYYQIYDKKGVPILEEGKLRSFGSGVRKVIKESKQLVIISKSKQSSTPVSINTMFGTLSGKKGAATKFPEFINVIDLNTKKFIFNKRIKTGDKVKFIKLLKNGNGLIVIENNQVYIINYNTAKKENVIKSKTKILYIDDESTLYLAKEDATGIYGINKTTGKITQIINPRKTKKLKMTFVHELILTDNGIVISGLNKKDNMQLVKLDLNGNIDYAKTYISPNYQASWRMPIIENIFYTLIESEDEKKAVGLFSLNTGEFVRKFSYPIKIEENSFRNIGSYYVNKKDKVIYHIPKAEGKGFSKKPKKYNAHGIIVAKQF